MRKGTGTEGNRIAEKQTLRIKMMTPSAAFLAAEGCPSGDSGIKSEASTVGK
jgi:hypothetical protein